jgi:pimeloyl-ACP methyl ester carboxylesterase
MAHPRRASVALALVLPILGGACRRAPPATEGYAITDDSVRIYYRVVGSGDETVLVPVASLHGASLDALARGRRLVLYDHRGRARSDSVPRGRISLDHQFRDIEAVRRAVGTERFALIGWSGMGMELFVYTLRHPDRVTRLVQLTPVPPRQDPYFNLMVQDRIARIDTAAYRAVEARQQAGAYAAEAEYCRALSAVTAPATFADPGAAPRAPDVCAFPNEWPSRLGAFFNVFLESLGAYDWRPELARVTVPRLVIHGARDNIPLDGSREWVAGQPAARLLVVPDAAHWPHY